MQVNRWFKIRMVFMLTPGIQGTGYGLPVKQASSDSTVTQQHRLPIQVSSLQFGVTTNAEPPALKRLANVVGVVNELQIAADHEARQKFLIEKPDYNALLLTLKRGEVSGIQVFDAYTASRMRPTSSKREILDTLLLLHNVPLSVQWKLFQSGKSRAILRERYENAKNRREAEKACDAYKQAKKDKKAEAQLEQLADAALRKIQFRIGIVYAPVLHTPVHSLNGQQAEAFFRDYILKQENSAKS
jgi:hypothetical protein